MGCVNGMKHAIVKYNNGNGALLCNTCHALIAFGFDHVDRIYTCDGCKARLENSDKAK